MNEYNNDTYTENLIENIDNIHQELERFETNVKKLWYGTLVPYINHPDNKILQGLTDNDYHRFLTFMVNNSPVHKKLIDGLNFLNKCKTG